MKTYLGQKGYTIPKNLLSNEEQIKIRDELTIKPFTSYQVCSLNDDKKFPAYRESSNKFYVPHYYGIKNYGIPQSYKISEGLDINLEFNGQPRDYQLPVINKFIEHCENVKYGGGLLELYCAWGKTSASLYIMTKLKKKTLVIVHKEFLMNQWFERINQFLPEAKIGKIQGPIIDTENKDIVLCMLQSLISKDYPQSIFDEFGFTIIDEVHHISSQSFSNSLFKVVTKYMLGLSATMERKDGTTNVFKMFLGDVIYKAERKNDIEVEIRAINYKVNDDEFNETIMDYRGQPQNSSMISKLCEYNHRTEFIIKTLCDFIKVDNISDEIINEYKLNMDNNNPNCLSCNNNNNYLVKNSCCNNIKYCLPCLESYHKNKKTNIKCPLCNKLLKYEQNYIENKYIKPLEEKHVILMSHNLNILHYIYNKLVCKNLANVGYYIGGMSEKELRKTEKKQIVLATYSMSSEGLDIPTLNAEFLLTPKTDIVQTIGRVLRAKHNYSHPIIYDFIDNHDLFQRQWLKRKSYYKKQNYKIVGINNSDYNNNYNNWKIIYQPKNNLNIDNKKPIKNKIKNISNNSNKSNKSNKSISYDSEEDNYEDFNKNNIKNSNKFDDEICYLLSK